MLDAWKTGRALIYTKNVFAFSAEEENISDFFLSVEGK